MVICKYYQQGTCKFGSSCRFEHPRSDYSVTGESVLRGRYGGHQYTTNNYHGRGRSHGSYKVGNMSHDFEEVVRMIIQEVVQSEKGGQWPLSCFAPIKERSCFPGWVDYSPEEIRWKMYEAVQTGTLPEYQWHVKELYDRAELQRHYILNPNNEVLEIIEKLLHGEKIETETSFSFSQALVPAKDNNYVSCSSSSFGNSQQHNPASSNFVFRLPQLGGSSGQTAAHLQPTGFYGSGQVTPNVIIQSPTEFCNSSETQAPFGTVAQDFSRLQPSSHVAEFSSTVFGGNRSVFNSAVSVVDNSLYSSKAELSQDELNAFVARTFMMGNIPTKPPPKELCTF